MTANGQAAGEPAGDARVAALRFEHHREPLGIGEASPRLTWVVDTAATGWYQAAYELESYGSDGRLQSSTGRVESGESVLVPWPFEPLVSRERRSVRVRVWGVDGRPSGWSEPFTVEAGLLRLEDWVARFLTPGWDEDTSRPQPCPMFRREFEVRAGVRSARLYVTALGVYEAELNGQAVGDHVLAPGWTSYHRRLRYQTFDVGSLLRPGENALGALVGDGWYRGRLGFGGGRRNIYGDRLALLAQLVLEYDDGTTEIVATDESWRAATGPILSSDLYDGETYDARLERPGWSAPGYDDREWFRVGRLERNLGTLVAPAGPPVRRTQVVEPVSITELPSGRQIVDFGQNLVGRLRLSVTGQAGDTITLRHAEVLEGGELSTRPLRQAAATDRYTLRGGGEEAWEPRFTFHGFRYAEVDGWPGELHAGDIQAVVCHSDMERTGWFECSDPLINRLHENVVWSMRGNFLDIPTDCPQRDERLGWTGDIQVFAPAACFLYDTAGFLSSWLRDLAADQDESGAVPFVVPNVLERPPTPAAAWGDAAVIVPWVLYRRYADVGILAAHYDSMRGWVDCVARLAGESRLWDSGFQFGDWLDPSAPPDQPWAAKVDPHLLATAYFARSAELLGLAAGVLGQPEDEARYLGLAAEVRAAFAGEYVTPNGRVVSDSATGYALALEFALLPEEGQRSRAGQRLAGLVRESGYRISTGFVGTPLVCDALCSIGEYEAAFRLLTQREVPSWLYPVTMGATTIWERWDSLLPDGSVNPGEMTSFNHYALGAIADWLHRTVGGIAPLEPGYRRVELRPRPGGGLTSARARHTTAVVTLPCAGAEPFEVGSGVHTWSCRLPAPPRRTLSLDSTLGELLDDPEAWEAVVRYLPELTGAAGGPPWRMQMPLRQLLALLPGSHEKQITLESALGKLHEPAG